MIALKRIKDEMTMVEAALAISDESHDALTIVVNLMTKPQTIFLPTDPVFYLQVLDSLSVYGERVVELYAECDNSIDTMRAKLFCLNDANLRFLALKGLINESR